MSDVRAKGAILAGVWLALVLVTTARSSRADELTWRSDMPRFRPAEYVATGVLGAASLSIFFGVKDATQPHWTGGILFDDAARDAFRLRSPGARDTARTLSDVTVVSSVVLTVGLDSLAVPLARKSSETALQLTLMDAEAFAVSTLVTTSLFKSIGRARPSYADCQRDPSFDPLCNSAPTASFPSGHANVAFTAAGLSCAHHAYLSLYGSAWADAAACGGMITLATATGALRVMGDRHYASDVLTSAVLGFGIGFGAPTLLHFTAHESASPGAVLLAPMGGTSTMGVAASGSF